MANYIRFNSDMRFSTPNFVSSNRACSEVLAPAIGSVTGYVPQKENEPQSLGSMQRDKLA